MAAASDPGDGEPTLAQLTTEIRDFVDSRGWRQYHNPKNLALALAGETGELCSELQWLDAEQAASLREHPPGRDALAGELADVAIYLLRLADELDVDLADAVRAKQQRNAQRFPPPR